MGLCHGLDAEVVKHGIGFPASQELNGVFVNLGAEEGSGTAWMEAASTEEGWLDASLWL